MGNLMLFPWQSKAGISSSPSSMLSGVAVGPGFFARCGGRNLQAQSRNAIHLLVVGDPPACGIIVNWEANKRDSEMSLHGITCIFVDGGSGVVFGYQLCPVVTLLSLRFPPLPSCFHHYRLLFTPQLLTLHTTTKETADPTLFLFDPRFVSREPNETSRSGAA